MRYSAGNSLSTSSMKGHTIIDAQDHPIEAVTLYSKRAEVRRVITLELKAGRNDFSIINLPSTITSDTFHVSGLSVGQASVVDTTCVVPRPKTTLFGGFSTRQTRDVSDKKYQARVVLEMKKNQLLREQSLIHAKNDALLTYAKTLTGENTGHEDFVEFLSQFNEAGQASLAATSQIEAAVEDVELKIKKLNLDEQDDESSDEEVDLSPKQKTKAGVVVSAKEDCSVKLILTYVVSGASWTPAYELHAITDQTTKAVADTVTLHYRASVVQMTGEDWEDVNLTLSTAELSTNMAVPTLARSFIRDVTYQPQPPLKGLFTANNNCGGLRFGGAQQVNLTQQQAQATAPFAFGSSAFSTRGLFGASTSAAVTSGLLDSTGTVEPPAATAEPHSPVLVEANPEYQPLDHASAEAKDQILASTYRVDTPVRVQSDDTPHRVTIMAVQLAAETEYVTVPAVTRSAYLQASYICKAKNTSSHQFPPGPIVTYLDGSYIETSRLWLVLPKGEITRSLGTDPGIRVLFKRTSEIKKAPPANMFARQTTTIVTDKITIKNTRSSVVPRVLVRHAIPTPGNDERFRVTLKEPEGLVQLESGSSLKLRDHVSAKWAEDASSEAGSSGLLAWSIDQLAAGGSEEIKMVYEVTAPEGVKWHQS